MLLKYLDRLSFYLYPFLVLIALFLVGLSWQDSTAGYRNNTVVDESHFNVLNAALFVSEQLESGNYDADQLDAALIKVLEFDPLDPLIWAIRAEVTADFEKKSVVEEYIQRAETLGGNRWNVHARLVKAWMKLDEKEKAYANAKRLTELFPPAIGESLQLVRESGADLQKLVKIFTSKETEDGYKPHYREKRLLAFARDEKDRSLANAVWEQSDADLRRLSGAALTYLNGSYSELDRIGMLAAWRRVMKIDRKSDVIWNGGFELPLENLPLTWIVEEVDGAKAYIDRKTSYKDGSSVTVVFDGTRNVDYHHFRQRIPVSGGGTYEVKLYWRGRKITSDSGVYFEIYGTAAPKNGGGYRSIAKSTVGNQTWSWKPISIEFDVSSDIEYLEVRLSRKKSDLLNNKLSGRVWIDEVILEKK